MTKNMLSVRSIRATRGSLDASMREKNAVTLVDEDGDKRMVWDSQGSSGYQDLLEEATE